MRFLNGFVLAQGGFPIARLAKGAGFGFAGFGVGGVEGEGAGAVRDGGFVVFELGMGLIWQMRKGDESRGDSLPLSMSSLCFVAI